MERTQYAHIYTYERTLQYNEVDNKFADKVSLENSSEF